MRFGERMGFLDSDFLQINGINARLRNRLWNLVNDIINEPSLDFCIKEIAQIVVDRCGVEINEYHYSNVSKIKGMIQNNLDEYDWYIPYEIIETIFECIDTIIADVNLIPRYQDLDELFGLPNKYENRLEKILTSEKSGYRMLNGEFVPVTNKQELESINESLKTPYDSVNQHMQKAIEAFSSKTNPDYEGTIKNAISAVESMCSIIVGKNTTLNKALNKLEKNGVKIHPTLKDAFIKLYAYTCDETGIRHGGIDFQNAPQEDAKYMLITCSAFINYLVEKI